MSFRSRQVQLSALEHDTDTCCVVDQFLNLVYCNPAWDTFARANGGTDAAHRVNVVDKSLLSFIPTVLKGFFADRLNTLLTGMGTWKHDYECSTPSEFRIIRLQVCPLLDARELLLCHSVITVRPHFRSAAPGFHTDGPVVMCSHCRRTSRNAGTVAWDWVPEHLAHPPENRADGLCDACEAYYSIGRNPWPDGVWHPAS